MFMQNTFLQSFTLWKHVFVLLNFDELSEEKMSQVEDVHGCISHYFQELFWIDDKGTDTWLYKPI